MGDWWVDGLFGGWIEGVWSVSGAQRIRTAPRIIRLRHNKPHSNSPPPPSKPHTPNPSLFTPPHPKPTSPPPPPKKQNSFTSKKLYHHLERLFGWIEQHYVLGPLAYCACVIVFSLLCVPESALTVGGGYIFAQAHGVVGGIVLCASLVVVGGITGAFLAFLIARYLCFDTVRACVCLVGKWVGEREGGKGDWGLG